ncbi:MAG: biopolymer transporter ExbD, partial [Cyclobacteriaceae bacterium]
YHFHRDKTKRYLDLIQIKNTEREQVCDFFRHFGLSEKKLMEFKKQPRVVYDEINAGSMADIAFLLLVFFLVATTINVDKGLAMKLPPEKQERSPLNERNVFNIKINSLDEIMINGEVRQSLEGLQTELNTFILNRGRKPELSTSPDKAIISVKTNRGTNYERFIEVLDEIKGAYYQIYGNRVGLSSQQYRALQVDKPAQKAIYDRGKAGIPMNISIAEPD